MKNLRSIFVLVTICALFAACCNRPASTGGEEIKQEIVFDSVIVSYWNGTDSIYHNFCYKNDTLRIDDLFLDSNDTIQEEYKDRFLSYVDELYVSEKNIILSEKDEPASETDFPLIKTTIYKGKGNVLETTVILRSNIEFSPKFLDFHSFLDNLAKGN